MISIIIILVRSLNSTFLVIIPKRASPKNRNNFQPISLIGCVYKLLFKVLAKQLSKVFNLMIGECHQAFVFGRQISDAILIANVTVDDVITNNKKDVLCKLDMEKVFDHVN